MGIEPSQIDDHVLGRTFGRSKKGVQSSTVGYQVVGSIASSLQRKAALERCKGYFVIATNDMTLEVFDKKMLLRLINLNKVLREDFVF